MCWLIFFFFSSSFFWSIFILFRFVFIDNPGKYSSSTFSSSSSFSSHFYVDFSLLHKHEIILLLLLLFLFSSFSFIIVLPSGKNTNILYQCLVVSFIFCIYAFLSSMEKTSAGARANSLSTHISNTKKGERCQKSERDRENLLPFCFSKVWHGTGNRQKKKKNKKLCANIDLGVLTIRTMYHP